MKPLDHRSTCKGDVICPRCGRRMCVGCTTKDEKGELFHTKGHAGECLICSGMYTEKGIILYPPTLPARSQKRYRLIRLQLEDNA
jgi:hypothetical protein